MCKSTQLHLHHLHILSIWTHGHMLIIIVILIMIIIIITIYTCMHLLNGWIVKLVYKPHQQFTLENRYIHCTL